MATGEEDEGRSCLPRPLAPMYASLGSGPVATSPPSAPPSAFGSCSSGGGRGCVPQEGQRPGGGRASGRGTSVWQVSEAAGTGVSFSEASSALPRRCRDPSGARPDSAVLWSPRPTTPLPAPRPSRPPAGPWLCRPSVLTQRVGARRLLPPAPFPAPDEASAPKEVSPSR